jgi:hypothetical protein
MGTNLTRFYLDVDEDCRTGCLTNRAFEDVETIEADEYEKRLQEEEITYIRIDF